MEVFGAVFAVLVVLFLALLAFIFVSIHVLRCTENAQERFSWASVRRSIRWAIKCVSGR